MNLDLGDTRLILKECDAYGLSQNQTAYVLATTYWETARTMKPVEEGFWLANADAWRKKNLRYYPWHGRGYVQLTWKANYLKAGKSLDIDLTTNPDRVMVPGIAARILVKGSLEGWFTGKKLGDYINASKTDFKNARRIINGTDKMQEIADIAQDYLDTLLAQPAPATENLPAPWFAHIVAAIVAIFSRGK